MGAPERLWRTVVLVLERHAEMWVCRVQIWGRKLFTSASSVLLLLCMDFVFPFRSNKLEICTKVLVGFWVNTLVFAASM